MAAQGMVLAGRATDSKAKPVRLHHPIQPAAWSGSSGSLEKALTGSGKKSEPAARTPESRLAPRYSSFLDHRPT